MFGSMTPSDLVSSVQLEGDEIPQNVQEFLQCCRGIGDLSDMPNVPGPSADAPISFSPEHAGLIHALNLTGDCSASFYSGSLQ